jgi:hypothetical protein
MIPSSVCSEQAAKLSPAHAPHGLDIPPGAPPATPHPPKQAGICAAAYT